MTLYPIFKSIVSVSGTINYFTFFIFLPKILGSPKNLFVQYFNGCQILCATNQRNPRYLAAGFLSLRANTRFIKPKEDARPP